MHLKDWESNGSLLHADTTYIVSTLEDPIIWNLVVKCVRVLQQSIFVVIPLHTVFDSDFVYMIEMAVVQPLAWRCVRRTLSLYRPPVVESYLLQARSFSKTSQEGEWLWWQIFRLSSHSMLIIHTIQMIPTCTYTWYRICLHNSLLVN